MGLSCSKDGSKVQMEITLGQWQILLSDDLDKINDTLIELKNNAPQYRKEDRRVIERLLASQQSVKEDNKSSQ